MITEDKKRELEKLGIDVAKLTAEEISKIKKAIDYGVGVRSDFFDWIIKKKNN